jgi:hypothetical protein
VGIKKLVPRAVRTKIKAGLQARTLQMGQAGQDYWVIGEVFNERRGGYFVDIGAHDGVELSNTFLLEKRYGWTSVCVEANPRVLDERDAQRHRRRHG